MKNILKEPSVWLIVFLVGFPQISETIYTPSLPQLVVSLQTTDSLIQQTLSIYFLGFAFGVLFWGITADKIGRRPSILYGILVYIIASLGCLLANNVCILITFRFVQAFGAATGSVVTQTIIRDCYNDIKRPQIFAKISGVLAFSPAIGPLLGGLTAQYLGISAVFGFLILMGIGIGIGTFFQLIETRPAITIQTNKLRPVLDKMIFDRQIWLFGGLIGIMNGILFSYYAEAPFIFIDHLGFEPRQYGFLGICVALATFTGAWLSRMLTKKHHYKKIIILGYTVMVIGELLFLFTILFTSYIILLIIGIVIGIFIIMCGLGIALPHCLSQVLNDYKNSLGIAGALLGFYYYLLVGTIIWLISKLHNDSLIILPVFLLILSIIMLGFSKFLKADKTK